MVRKKIKGLIPHYTEGFVVDWNVVMPVGYRDFRMYIHERLCLQFSHVQDVASNSLIYVGELIEDAEELGKVNFKERIEEVRDILPARLNKVFDGKRKSLFFLEDEVQYLGKIFAEGRFTAFIEVVLDDEVIPIEDLPRNLYKIVKPFFDAYNVAYILSSDDYRQVSRIKKVKTKKKGSDGDLKKGGVKTLLSMLGLAVSAVGVIVSAKFMNDGINEAKGKIIEAEIVEEKQTRKK